MSETERKCDMVIWWMEAIAYGPKLEKRRLRRETATLREMRTLALYVMFRNAMQAHNDAVAKVKKAMAEEEKLRSLKECFNNAKALKHASKLESDPVPGQFVLAALYVVVEGFIQWGLSDNRIDALLRSPYVNSMRRLRNGVFHYQPNRANEKLLGFMTAGGHPKG